jgi:hypothetical protein
MVSLSLRSNGMKLKKIDDYMTPLSAWQNIEKYLPKDKIIWEAFKGDSSSAEHLRSLGCNVICDDVDFFTANLNYDIIVTNPPFSKKIQILKKLEQIDKPFILIMPVSIITKQYYHKYFADKCGVIIPSKRIQFLKNGNQLTRCCFDCVYVCYKIEGVNSREIIYI